MAPSVRLAAISAVFFVNSCFFSPTPVACSSTLALVDDHVLVLGDHEATVVAKVHEDERLELGGRAAGRGGGCRVQLVNNGLDGSKAVRRLVAVRTAALAVVGLVALGLVDPVPADLLEVNFQLIAAAARLGVATDTVIGLVLRPLLPAEDQFVLGVHVERGCQLRVEHAARLHPRAVAALRPAGHGELQGVAQDAGDAGHLYTVIGGRVLQPVLQRRLHVELFPPRPVQPHQARVE